MAEIPSVFNLTESEFLEKFKDNPGGRHGIATVSPEIWGTIGDAGRIKIFKGMRDFWDKTPTFDLSAGKLRRESSRLVSEAFDEQAKAREQREAQPAGRAESIFAGFSKQRRRGGSAAPSIGQGTGGTADDSVFSRFRKVLGG